MQQKLFFRFFLLCVVLFCTSWAEVKSSLPTFFSYRISDVKALKTLESKEALSEEELEKWDEHLYTLIEKKRIDYLARSHFFVYLYSAQRDAAFLSYEAKECFEGSFDPLSARIFKLFFPEEDLPPHLKKDAYSDKLALIVGDRYAKFYAKEKDKAMIYWQLWGLAPQEIQVPSPPDRISSSWNKQLKAIENAQSRLTKEQEKAMHIWDGAQGCNFGDWRVITNNHLIEAHEPLAKMCLIRSLVAIANIDAIIICQRAKITYDIKRPYEQSPSIKLLVSPPCNASYPSTHAAVSFAAAEILCSFFPDETKKWEETATEASLSRIWGGVHYPIDKRAGESVGVQISNKLLEQIRLH